MNKFKTVLNFFTAVKNRTYGGIFMTKTKKAVLAALACSAVLAGAVGLAACGGGDGHTCEWETEWTYNAENLELGHWHKCKDSSCKKVNGTEAHHWGEWTADTANEGHDKRECPDCHAVDSRVTPEPHVHSWGLWEVADEDQPTEEHGGKATRTCLNDDCDPTHQDKEFTLPNIEEGV